MITDDQKRSYLMTNGWQRDTSFLKIEYWLHLSYPNMISVSLREAYELATSLDGELYEYTK